MGGDGVPDQSNSKRSGSTRKLASRKGKDRGVVTVEKGQCGKGWDRKGLKPKCAGVGRHKGEIFKRLPLIALSFFWGRSRGPWRTSGKCFFGGLRSLSSSTGVWATSRRLPSVATDGWSLDALQ